MVGITHNGNMNKPYKLNITILTDKDTHNGSPLVTLDRDKHPRFIYETEEETIEFDTLHERDETIYNFRSNSCDICGDINNCKEDI